MSDSEISTQASAPSNTSPRRGRRWLRIVLYALAAVVLVVAAFAISVVVWFRAATRAALPQLDGEIHLAGLSAPVMVRRDTHGVPCIEAAGADDLYVAQGYVTAQDRLWQMDTFRRNANGELAEVFGPTLVKHDRMQRVLGFRAAAERIYAALSAEDKRRLEDYARGVNMFIAQHPGDLPQEFRLLRYEPKPWRGVDSISIGTMMIDMLDTHWDVKLHRERIRAKLNNPQLEAELYPVGSWRDRPPTGEVIDLTKPQPNPPKTKDDEDDDSTQTLLMPRGRALPPVRAGLAELLATLGKPDCDECAAGSNNWVVSGAHTASGKPLLANDMHLPINVPNIWYMAELKGPGVHVGGVTLPGVPDVIAGHNEHVAWGFTALYADVQDLYVEKVDGKGNYQDASGAWKPFAVDREVIHVRGAKDVVIDVQSTAHGRIVTPLIPGESRTIALRWTLYDPALNALPIHAMNVASNWAEFSAAIGTWCWPTQNLIYADDQGHIAYHAVGKVPIRPGGLAALPIADAGHEWQGYVPFDAMPNAFDPPSGFLATANSRVTTDKSPYPISLEWLDPYRVARIYKLLQGRDGLTPKDMIAAQTDIYSEVDQELAHRFAYAIDHAEKVDERLRKAADLMRSWDGRLTADSVAASLVDQARRALWPLILEPKLGDLAKEYRWSERDFAEEEIVMHGATDWLPPGNKNWDAVLAEAVRRGMSEGKAPADVSSWKYGSWHVVEVEHPLASIFPVLFRNAQIGPYPLSGDETTPKQVGRDFGPSQRFTMDWSNIDGSTENIVLGESGNPQSQYYRDQWNDWYGGTTFAMPFSDAAVSAGARHVLKLLP